MATQRRFRLASVAGATLVATLLTFSAAPAQALDLGILCDILGCDVPHEGKAECYWTQTGANVPVGTPGVPPGTSYVTQLITLHCPNHIELGKLQYGWKSCVTAATGADCSQNSPGLSVTDLGRKDEGPCSSWSRTWQVFAPNFNVYDAWFRVHTLKDVDCDKKPDDWNQRIDCPPGADCPPFHDDPEPKIWRQHNDGSVTNYGDGALDGNPCDYDNTFYTGPAAEDKPRSAGGTRDPRFFGYFPKPDGQVNECDWQTWEYQWRQYN